MTDLAVAWIVFACAFGSASLGLLLQSRLPTHHLNPDTKEVVKLTMGLLATMAALVLGLLTASAKSSFDAETNEIEESAAATILLDRVLAQYGPETKGTRDLLRRAVERRLALTWPEDGAEPALLDAPEAMSAGEAIEDRIRELSPQSDSQRSLRSRALELSGNVVHAQWLVLVQANAPIPRPFLVVLVAWISVLLLSFSLFAPRNGTVVAALLVCALAVSASIFVILEMSRPFEGLIKIPSAPLRVALSHLGR